MNCTQCSAQMLPPPIRMRCTRLPFRRKCFSCLDEGVCLQRQLREALRPPNSFRAVKTPGPIFGEPHVRSLLQAGDGRLLFEYLPKVIERNADFKSPATSGLAHPDMQ